MRKPCWSHGFEESDTAVKMPAQGAGEDVTLRDGWRADKKLLRGGLIALRLGRRT